MEAVVVIGAEAAAEVVLMLVRLEDMLLVKVVFV